MVPQALLRSDDLAIAIDLIAQSFSAIERLARLGKHLDAASVFNAVLTRD
jgi:hypothetical protein